MENVVMKVELTEDYSGNNKERKNGKKRNNYNRIF